MVCADSKSQGRVILNEFLSDASASCKEFIELTNLGPSNQNIGCYIILSRKFAITIPANTILTP
jgi:hypothetical protein